MSKSEILAAIEELRTSISKLQTSFDSNLQTTNPSPPPPITPTQYPDLLHRTHSTSLLPIRRLSPSEIEEKNDRGLCYNCDQTWSDTHLCRSKFLILFGADDEDDFGDPKSPDFMAEVEVTVKGISSLCASEQPPPSPHPFTGLDPLSLLPLIVLQPLSPPPPTSPLPIPLPPTEPPPNVLPSPAKPPPPPITPSASPSPILGSRFWLLVGSKDEIVAVAFGSISAAISDVLTVGVVSSFYPSMVVIAGQEVQLCGEPSPNLVGTPSPAVSVLEFAWINFVQVFSWDFCRAYGERSFIKLLADFLPELLSSREENKARFILLEKYGNGTSKRFILESDLQIRTILEDGSAQTNVVQNSDAVATDIYLSWLPKTIKEFVLPVGFPDSLYQFMLESLVELNHFIFPSVLRACSAINDLRTGERVHERILKSGFESDPVIETSLLSIYGEMGCLHSARKMFDEMSIRDSVSKSSIMSNYVHNGEASKGLGNFREMMSGGVEIDSVTMLSAAEACGELGLWRFGKSCHGFAERRDLGSDHEALWSSLVARYGKFGDLFSAEKLFFCSGFHPSVIQWTALISCYNQNGYFLEALRTFAQMLQSGVEGNRVTLMNVVCTCARLGWLREGKSVHGYVLRNNVRLDKDFLRSSLIDLYANCGELAYARRVCDTSRYKHLVTWNILISGCVREHKADEALSLFVGMLSRGISADSFSLASALSACGMIELSEMGCQILRCRRKLQSKNNLQQRRRRRHKLTLRTR